jgi:hypothetical protein
MFPKHSASQGDAISVSLKLLAAEENWPSIRHAHRIRAGATRISDTPKVAFLTVPRGTNDIGMKQQMSTSVPSSVISRHTSWGAYRVQYYLRIALLKGQIPRFILSYFSEEPSITLSNVLHEKKKEEGEKKRQNGNYTAALLFTVILNASPRAGQSCSLNLMLVFSHPARMLRNSPFPVTCVAPAPWRQCCCSRQ